MLNLKRIILTAVFILFTFTGLDFKVAAAVNYTYGDWVYAINPDEVTCTIVKYTGAEQDVVIPYELEEYTVTTIGNGTFHGTSAVSVKLPYSIQALEASAFAGNQTIVSIDMSEANITSLNAQAFVSCQGLEAIILPGNLENIGNACFQMCTSLTSIEIPDSVTSIGNMAFHGCSGLINVKLSDNITYIPSQAFRECTSLTEIIIPDSVTDIKDSAFYGCTSLSSIKLSDNITHIGEMAFIYCTFDTELPKNIEWIESLAFAYNPNISAIIPPEGCKILEVNAFYGCSGVKEIILPESIEQFCSNGSAFIEVKNFENLIINCDIPYGNDFYGHNSLKTLTVNAGQINDNSAFSMYTQLETVIFGDENSIRIGNGMFMGCNNLKNVIFGKSVTEIGSNAFTGCTELTDLITDENITKIGLQAFAGCQNLTRVVIEDAVTVMDDYAFAGCPSLKTVIFMHEDTLPSTIKPVFFSTPVETFYVKKGNSSYFEDVYIPSHSGALPSNIQVKEFPYVIYDVYDPFTDTTENGEESIYYNVTDWDLELNGITDRSGEPLELKWYTDDNYTTPYTIGELPVTNIEEPVYLYARYEPLTFDISYHSLYGAENTNPTEYAYGTGLTLAAPGERTGYDFIGWYDADSNGNQVTAISNTDSGDKELWAVWEADEEDSIGNITDENNGNPDENTNEHSGGGNNIINPVPTPKEPPKTYPNIDTAPDDDLIEYDYINILDDKVPESILPDENNIPESDIQGDELPENDTLDDDIIIPEADNPKTGNSYLIVVLSASIIIICLYTIKKYAFKKNSPVGNYPENND